MSTPPTKPMWLGRGLQRRRDAGEVGALVLGEQQAGQVVQARRGHRGVDDREAGVRVLRGDLGDVLAVGEADGDDRVVALVGELGEQVGAVGGVGVGAQLGDLAAVVLDGRLDARVGGVVERTVTPAAGVVGEADLEVTAARCCRRWRCRRLLVAGTGREGHAAGQQQRRGLRHPRSAQDDLLSGGTRRWCRGASRWVQVSVPPSRRPGPGPSAHDLGTLTASARSLPGP